jgi:hypothetical protein
VTKRDSRVTIERSGRGPGEDRERSREKTGRGREKTGRGRERIGRGSGEDRERIGRGSGEDRERIGEDGDGGRERKTRQPPPWMVVAVGVRSEYMCALASTCIIVSCRLRP